MLHISGDLLKAAVLGLVWEVVIDGVRPEEPDQLLHLARLPESHQGANRDLVLGEGSGQGVSLG